jgi:hypothetical protein
MRRVERSTAFKRDYRRFKAISRYRDLDVRLVDVLSSWSTTARYRSETATMRWPEIGRAIGTVISGPTCC